MKRVPQPFKLEKIPSPKLTQVVNYDVNLLQRFDDISLKCPENEVLWEVVNNEPVCKCLYPFHKTDGKCKAYSPCPSGTRFRGFNQD